MIRENQKYCIWYKFIFTLGEKEILFIEPKLNQQFYNGVYLRSIQVVYLGSIQVLDFVSNYDVKQIASALNHSCSTDLRRYKTGA